MEAIWAVIGSYVTTGAVRNVAASATLAVGLTFFITVYLLQVHFKRVVVKSASAALNLDALVGVKALPAKSHWSHRTREPARHERPPRFFGSNQARLGQDRTSKRPRPSGRCLLVKAPRRAAIRGEIPLTAAR